MATKLHIFGKTELMDGSKKRARMIILVVWWVHCGWYKTWDVTKIQMGTKPTRWAKEEWVGLNVAKYV